MRFKDSRNQRRLRAYVRRHGGEHGAEVLANPTAFAALQEQITTPSMKRRAGVRRGMGEGGILGKIIDAFAANPGSFKALIEMLFKMFSGIG